MAYIKIRGFAPDTDPTIPGVLTEVDNLAPTTRGYEAMPSAANAGVEVLTASSIAAVSIQKLDGSARTFAGTADDLFERDSSAWTKVSRTGGYSTTINWRYIQFGNETIMVNGVDTAQGSISGAFADITAGPAAKIIEVIERQAIVFDVDGDTDRWRTSAQDNAHDWATSVSTLAATGRIVDTPGAITAGRRLGSNLGVYKKRSLYLGRFAGAPEIWDFDLVSDEVGAPSQEAVVSVEDLGHLFPSNDDFYLWNGSAPQHIAAGLVSDWFFNTQLDADNINKIIGVQDAANSRAIWFYPSLSGGGALDKWIAYHWHSKKWGAGTLSVQSAFRFLDSSAPTYNTLGDFYATYDDLPLISYDSALWNISTVLTGIFNTSNQLQTLSGGGSDTSIMTGDFGSEETLSFVTRMRPRFVASPTTGKMVNSYRETLGDSLVSSSNTSVLSNGKFDFTRESRWHRFRKDYTGTMEILGFDISVEKAGDE